MASLLYRYYVDMTAIMKNLDWAVKKGGNIFLVIGDNKTFGGNEDIKVLIKSSASLLEIGKKIGGSILKQFLYQ